MSRVSTLIICLSICDVTDREFSPPHVPKTGCKIQQINDWFHRPDADYDMPGGLFQDLSPTVNDMTSGTKHLETSILIGAMNHFGCNDFDDLCKHLEGLEWSDPDSSGVMCVHDEMSAQFWTKGNERLPRNNPS